MAQDITVDLGDMILERGETLRADVAHARIYGPEGAPIIGTAGLLTFLNSKCLALNSRQQVIVAIVQMSSRLATKRAASKMLWIIKP